MGHSVGLRVDPRRDEPLHRQIFDQIVARIQTRAFPPGFKLPPTRVLARELQAHRNTIARAYADLEAAGFVCGSVGRGTYVEGAPRSSNTAPAPVAPLSAAASKASSGSRGPHAMPWSSLVSVNTRPELLARAERWARKVDGRDVINLARMQPSDDLLPADLMRRCTARVLDEHGAKAMSYAPPEGVPRLREAIARELASRGVPANEDDVIITSGSQQGLDLVARTLINPGDTILVESTTYSGAIDIFTLAGARLSPIACDDDGPIPEALERVGRAGVKALYLMPTGHNPTGRTISTARRRAIAAWSRESGIPILEDDFVAGLSLDEEREEPPYMRALDGDVVHLSTFSKRLIPSLRVGYIVAPNELRAPLRSMKRVVDLGSSGILQHSLAEFIERGYLRAHTARVAREYRARRDVLDGALRKNLPGEITWRVPTHGIVLWLALPNDIDANAVHEEALRQGVLVSPSPMWSVDPNAPPALRVAFCSESEPRLAEGARRLGKALKTVLSRDRSSSRRDPEPRVLEAV